MVAATGRGLGLTGIEGGGGVSRLEVADEAAREKAGAGAFSDIVP